MLAATVAIVRIRSRPEARRARTFQQALEKAESDEARERVVLCMPADKADQRSVTPFLRQRLGQPLPAVEKGVVRPASTDGVTQMPVPPGKGKPAA